MDDWWKVKEISRCVENSDNNDNETGQQVDSYRRILDHYPVILGRKCPNFSQLKALGFPVLRWIVPYSFSATTSISAQPRWFY